jgi:hypothetical protein
MARIPLPKPGFLDHCDYLGFISGERRWRSKDGTWLYTWDSMHGEIEVFNRRGRHIGVADALTGVVFAPGVPGRRIDV